MEWNEVECEASVFVQLAEVGMNASEVCLLRRTPLKERTLGLAHSGTLALAHCVIFLLEMLFPRSPTSYLDLKQVAC